MKKLLCLICIILILIIIVIACLLAPKKIVGDKFTLSLKQTVVLKDYDNIKITLKNISDSRCIGENIQCIWQGEVAYELKITYKGSTKKYSLSTEREKSINVDKYVIEIIDYDDIKSVTFQIK